MDHASVHVARNALWMFIQQDANCKQAAQEYIAQRLTLNLTYRSCLLSWSMLRMLLQVQSCTTNISHDDRIFIRNHKLSPSAIIR